MDKKKFSLLNNITYPKDLRRLSIDQLPQLCKELREDIIDEVSINPGHFASYIIYMTPPTTALCGTWGIRPMSTRC